MKCLSEVAVEVEDGILDDTLVSAVLSRSEAVTSVEAKVDEKGIFDDSIVFGVFGEAEVSGNLIVVSVVLSVSELELSVSAVLWEAEVDDISNLVDSVVSVDLGKSDVELSVSVVLGEAEVDEVGNLVDSVVSVVLVKSEVELSISVVLVFDSDDNGEFVEKLVC